MLHWLQAVIDWIVSLRSSLVQLSIQAPNTIDPPNRPYDPESWVRAPKGRAPAGRNSSIAVAEPVDDERVVAVGGPNSDRALIHQSVHDG